MDDPLFYIGASRIIYLELGLQLGLAVALLIVFLIIGLAHILAERPAWETQKTL